MSDDTGNTDPNRWMLGGTPPDPQVIPEPEPIDPDVKLRNGDTHTGTDPLGRAIGPAEDHLRVKRVRDDKGKIVTPKTKGASTADVESRAQRVAEATGTEPEAVDNPTPLSPAQVAALHSEA